MAEAGSFSLEAFRAAVAAASRSEGDHIIVAYSRRAFLQTGAPGICRCLHKLIWCLEMNDSVTFCAQPPSIMQAVLTMLVRHSMINSLRCVSWRTCCPEVAPANGQQR